MSKYHILLCALAPLVSFSCNKKHASKAQMPPLAVEVAEVGVDSLYDKISFVSEINALDNAIIQPRVDGFLKSIDYEGGSYVRRGQLLFTLEEGSFLTSLYASEAEVESENANLLLAQRNYERAVPLVKINAISESDFDQYEASYKAARATLRAANENLLASQLNLSYTNIYAPLDGLASKTSASVGDYVGLSTEQNELTTISYIDTVSVELAIPTSEYLKHSVKAKDGQYDNAKLLSDIRLMLSDSVSYSFKGEYYYTQKDTPSNSSTVVVVVKFANPSQVLRPGMFAKISANIGAKEAMFVVPQRAVSQMQGVNSVWVVGADSLVQIRELTLGGTYGDMWEVKKGLTAGEKVLLTGQLKMRDSEKVAPKTLK